MNTIDAPEYFYRTDDTQLLLSMLQMDSTSGQERQLAEHLALWMKTPSNQLMIQEVGNGTLNLYFTWGTPQVVFCTHMDTVPPYIPPTIEPLPDGDLLIKGRGSCDAKGQIYALWKACHQLESQGKTGFGLLILAGEETGSWGAKAFRSIGDCDESGQHFCADYVIVAEPTDGKMVNASKGTKAFEISLPGKAFHSGYPEYGESAIDKFIDFTNALRKIHFPDDEVLGNTTWNIGKLHSDNPQNILSDQVNFRLYFRTTPTSDSDINNTITQLVDSFGGSCQCFGGDTPLTYTTLPGFKTGTVAFGSDAPQLTNFRKKILCGAGSILCAHRPEEHVRLSQLHQAADNYVKMFQMLKHNPRI